MKILNKIKMFFSSDELYVLIRTSILCLVAVICHFLFLGAGNDSPEKGMYSFVRNIAAVIALVECRHFFGKGKVRAAITRVAESFGKFIGSVYKVIVRFVYRKNDTVISRYKTVGFTDSEMSISYGNKKKRMTYRYKPWNKMDDKEKVRYMYVKSVLKWNKKGYGITGSDTPNETLVKTGTPKGANKLVDVYNCVRYDDGCEMTSEMLGIIEKR